MDLERTQKPGMESSAAGTKMNTEGSCPATVTGAGSEAKTEVIRLKGLFGLLINTQDESVTRPTALPFPLLKANPNFVDGVASRDVVISDSPSVWARIFLPEKALVNKKTTQEQDEAAEQQQQAEKKSSKKVPVVLYFHGGGFVMLSPDVSFYHQHCEKLARRANAIVVSVDYRLAPEHRLPAAYEDAYTSLRWLRSQATVEAPGPQSEPWLAAYADFGRVFLAGDSAGANVAYHAAVRVGATAVELSPLVVRGQLLLQPMVGGQGRRTRSEVEGERSGFFSYETNDWLWRLSLPRGADSTHPYCDVAAAATKMQVLPPAIVAIGGLDWMHDRQLEFVAAMRRAGREVELVDYEHAKHGFFIYDSEETSRLLRSLATFIDKRSKL